MKNGKGKKKKPKKSLKKLRRNGYFDVSSTEKWRYMTVDPKRKLIKLAKGCVGSVVAGLHVIFNLFHEMSIQNNLAENIYNALEDIIRLRGPKTEKGIERRILGLISSQIFRKSWIL